MKKDRQSISVIVPAYNAQKYIYRTTNSILEQLSDIDELIVVNDGSTDETLKILKNIRKVNNKLKIINQKNKGVSIARNKGLMEANGEYVMFVDADDILLENAIDKLYYALSRNDDISIGLTKFENYKKEYRVTISNQKNHMTREDLLKLFLLGDVTFDLSSACAKLYKKSCISNLRFEKNRISNEDRYFFFQVLCNCKNIACVYNYVYLYEKHENSLSMAKVDLRILDNIYFAEKIHECINWKFPSLTNESEYNRLLTYMQVYREFSRDSTCKKKYYKEIEKVRKNIIQNGYAKNLCLSKRIELFIIKYMNTLYCPLLKMYDRFN